MSVDLLRYVQAFERLRRDGVESEVAPLAPPAPAPGAPVALLLSPHPDDEALTGGLPLRLRSEAGWRVVNLPVTLGSAMDQRPRRWRELQACCASLGFELLPAVHEAEGRLEPSLQQSAPAHWRRCVQTVAQALLQWRPRALFFPHAGDVQPAHVGTHALALAALREVGGRLQPATVHTEYWGTLPNPNLMVQLTVDDVARLAGAVACHVGEVARNPYHLNLPAQCIDAVRRGAELVGGLGQAAPAMSFAMLYRVQQWQGAGEVPWAGGGRTLACEVDPSTVV
jgi:N-acetylglucosamine malate deacetylase 1